MKWSFQIGKLLGIPIRVHLTFLLLLLFVGISGSKYGGPTGTIFGMISIVLIFLCVVLHEIGLDSICVILDNFHWLSRGLKDSRSEFPIPINLKKRCGV